MSPSIQTMPVADTTVPVTSGTTVIDCDIHNELPAISRLFPYLPDYWIDYIRNVGFGGPGASDYPPGAPTTARPGSIPEEGGPAGSHLQLVQKQVLDPWSTEVGILNCSYRVQSIHADDLSAALATAVNQWQLDNWLDPEPRLRGSLVVPSHLPERAAEEIERFGAHPSFVQVALPVRSYKTYGKRFYDPLYAAAVKFDLVLGINFGGAPGHAPTPVGWPSTYLEEHAGMAQVFQSQVTSMVTEGVFDRFPDLRVSLLEGGFAWMPSLMWRIDKEWKGLRANTPWVKRPPSDYMRDHIRLSVQPIGSPPEPDFILQTIEQMESDAMLMFATDYPHWHYDTDEEAWPFELPEPLHSNIWSKNAREWYRL
ncbi:MAG: amidohydrolase family protein [Chloroflexota bacterium]